MRDWSFFEQCYDELTRGDVYEQPDEEKRTDISRIVISEAPVKNVKSVLDVGCGYGYAQDLFPGVEYVGITCNEAECKEARRLGREVLLMDYNFIGIEKKFDLVFSSHSLEHSPFPLITLMEWHRVASRLLLIVPNPEHYGYIGRNHYSVATPQQVRWWLRRAGWRVKWNKITKSDLAFCAVHRRRIGYEGWAKHLNPEIFENDRDNRV